MTAPGKTSPRGVEDEPPPHGNSSPGPDGAPEIHPAAREHQPDLGWITDRTATTGRSADRPAPPHPTTRGA